MKKNVISLILLVSMLIGCAAPVFAADEQFLSEVALVYSDSVEDAKKAIEGTDWKLFEKDLNPNADYMFDDGVYLIYKTSTNVEDAITDLRVMDMYGGFSTSNYERQLEKSRNQYLAAVAKLRIIAGEFKTLYEAGDEMAKLAYRQMNYYKDIGESNMLMGDFILNIPSDDAFVRVLLEGNAIVTSNLISLLTIGISGTGDTALSNKIKEKYAIKDTLKPEDYHEKAVILEKSFKTISAKIAQYDAMVEEFDFEDEEASEEEYQFIMQFASIAVMLEGITLGNVTLADMLRTDTWTLTDLYPIAAALSEGQMSLTEMGAFETMLKYSQPSKPIDDLIESIELAEANMKDENGNIKPIDVYVGVDRSIFNGSFAMTNAAERQQALTGKTWDMEEARKASTDFYYTSGTIAALDFIVWIAFGIEMYESVGFMPFYQIYEVCDMIWESTGVTSQTGWKTVDPFVNWNTPGIYFWSAVGIALIAAGLSGISTWYNYYNPDYTEIPNNMIDVRETEIGDKYVKFTAAKVFGEEDMNADFNAYEGKEWNALYYTKDATAGNPLTPNFVYRENNATVSRRHQGVSMFGEAEAFNLNSHVYNDDAVGVYLSVRYSMTKKEAADIPSVISSMLSNGAYYMLTATGGIGIGMASTAIFLKLKSKKIKN